MKSYTFIIVFLWTSIGFAQVSFQKGYLVSNNGTRQEVFIKNEEWRLTPSEFTYRLSLNGENLTGRLAEVEEFGIYDHIKFEKHTVNVEISPKSIRNLSTLKKPELEQRTVFIEVLLEGQASLYQFLDGGITQFYYKPANRPEIKALIYKQYRGQRDRILENNLYKQQLSNDLICEEPLNFKNLDYKRTDLMRIFKQFANCANIQIEQVKPTVKQQLFNVKAIIGVDNQSFYVDSSQRRTEDFGSQTGITFGGEFEAIITPRNYKWSLFIDARYHSFDAQRDQETTNIFGDLVIISAFAEKKSVDFGLGVRHYLFLNDVSKIYFNALFSVGAITDTEVIYEGGRQDLTANTPTQALGLGVGYVYRNFNLEFRYLTNKNSIGREYGKSFSEDQTIMLTLGYRLIRF